MRLTFTGFLYFILLNTAFCVNYSWNGVTNNQWNTNTNWTPNGIPGVSDNVTISAGTGSPQLANSVTVINLTMNGGKTLNLNGFTLTLTGNLSASANAQINNGKLLCTSNTASIVLSNAIVGAKFSADIRNLTIQQTIFSDSCYIRKNGGGSNDNQANGGNTFNGITTIIQNSGSYLEWGKNPYGGDTFNNDLYVQVTGSQYIYLANQGNSVFQGNIYLTVNSASASTTIRFGQSGVGGKSTQAVGKSITTFGTYNNGQLQLYDFTQQTGVSTDNRFPFTASVSNVILDSTSINGKFIVTSASGASASITNSTIRDSLYLDVRRITIQKSIFNQDGGNSYIRKTSGGSNDDQANGGNTFNGITTIIQNSGSYLEWGKNPYGGDTFNNDLYVQVTGSQYIYLANQGNSVFQGNIYLTVNSASATTIRFGQSGVGGKSTQATGKSITTFGTYNNGQLQLYDFTQQTGASTDNRFPFTAAVSNVIIDSTSINGKFIVTSASGASASITNSTIRDSLYLDVRRITIQKSIFNQDGGRSYIRKTSGGSNDDQANGGNTFNGITTIIQNSGSFLEWGKNPYGGDTFNNDLYVQVTGSQYIYLANQGNSVFQGNIYLIVNSASASTTIRFGQSGVGGKSTQSAGKSITTFGTYNNGQLQLYDFTQQMGTTTDNRFPFTASVSNVILDSTSINGKFIVPSGTSTSAILTNSSIRDSLVLDVSRVTIQKCFFNQDGGHSYIRKTSGGSNDDVTNGGNVFYGEATLIQNSGSFFRWSTIAKDIFENNLYLFRTGSQSLEIAYTDTTVFKKNIVFNQSNINIGSNNGVLSSEGSAYQRVQGSVASVTAYQWSVNKPAQGVELNINMTVSNNLNLVNGFIDLNSKSLTITNNANTGVSRTSGYVISEKTTNLSKFIWTMGSTAGNHIFHFGKYDGTYIPLSFNLTAGTIGTVTVSTYPTAPDNTPYPVTPQTVTQMNRFGVDNTANVVDRFWQMDKTGGSGTATVTFTYAESEKPANGEDLLVSQRWNNSITDWDQPMGGQSADPVANTVTTLGITTFSPWTLSRMDSPLPVTLLEFKGKAKENNIILNWTIAQINVDFSHFELEKSEDGKEFNLVAKVLQENILYYFYSDSNIISSNNLYYRLKLVDKNGSYSYSSLVYVALPNNNEMNLFLYPNPASSDDKIRIVFTDNEPKECLVLVYDSRGTVLAEKLLIMENGEYVFSLDKNTTLTSGIYIIQASSNQKIVRKKLIIY